mmetsp:Transcript_3682/g.4839  ORF Transcript_3682/g.4839 Transcript_3682/m.4839 type:complete len:114 (+) Transcript_3682:227-568(+)
MMIFALDILEVFEREEEVTLTSVTEIGEDASDVMALLLVISMLMLILGLLVLVLVLTLLLVCVLIIPSSDSSTREIVLFWWTRWTFNNQKPITHTGTGRLRIVLYDSCMIVVI